MIARRRKRASTRLNQGAASDDVNGGRLMCGAAAMRAGFSLSGVRDILKWQWACLSSGSPV